jgi:hypothetical protein
MKRKKYKIELYEERNGYWRFEIWDGDVCICHPENDVGDEHKEWVRRRAIEVAEKQPDCGSLVINEHYKLVN